MILIDKSFNTEKNKILAADILDIIFDGRNKFYGAYELRKSYNQRLTKAIFFTIVLVLFGFLGTVYSNMTGKNIPDEMDVTDTWMAKVKVDPPPPAPPPPPKKLLPPPEASQIKFNTIKIVEEKLVDDNIREITDDVAISNIAVVSDIKEIIQAPFTEIASNIIEAPKSKVQDTVFVKVEVDAQFPGGTAAWARYLQKNLNPNKPVDNGATAGTYQVMVRFIVGKNGAISDVNAETNHGYGMEDEALKIIQRGPKWTPALQNGRYVNAYRRQPITFVVSE